MANKIENEKMEDKLKQDAVIEKVEDNQQLNQEISEKDEIENKKKAKNKIVIFLFIVGVILLGFFIYNEFIGKYKEKTENAYVNADKNPITSQVSGIVKEVYVTDTQEVKEGQLLAVIDDTDYRVALEAAEAGIGQAVRGYYSTMAMSDTANQDIKLKEISAAKAAVDYSRDLEAYKSGLISAEALANTKAMNDQAKAALRVSRANSQNAKVQISGTLNDFPALKQAIVAYKTAYINLNRTKIYSTINGKIAKKNINVGQRIVVNQELFTVVNLNNIWVDGNLKETQLKGLQIGDKVKLESDINKKEYEGYVVGISAGTGTTFSLLPAQNATGNWVKIVQRVPVKILISKESLEKNGTLPLGSSMKIDINLKRDKKQDKVEEIPQLNSSVKSNLYQLNESEMQSKINEIIEKNRP